MLNLFAKRCAELGSDGLVGGPRRTLIDFGDEEGSDGMTVDTEGRIYLASRRPSRHSGCFNNANKVGGSN